MIYLGLVVCFNTSIGQPPPPGSKIYYPDLDRFSGAWRCVTDSFEFEIVLKKVFRHFDSGNYDEDIVYGWHRYSKGSAVIEDYIMRSDIDSTHSIFLYIDVFQRPDSDTIIGNIHDRSKLKKLEMTLVFVSSNEDILVCEISPSGDIIVPPMKMGMTFPNRMIFKRKGPGGS